MSRRSSTKAPATVAPEPSPVGADRPPLAVAFAEPIEVLDVQLAELDPTRFVTARVSKIDQATVAAYAERMTEGDVFPPVETFIDDSGALWVGDGVHRVEAARKLGRATIPARVNDGGKLGALRFAAGANDSHGLRRTHADKRQAVIMLLEDPAFASESNRTIAELAKVSHPFVEAVKVSTGNVSSSIPKRGKDGKVRKAKAKKAERAVKPERAVKVARRGLDQVAKDWPKGMAVDLLVTAGRAWLQDLEGASAEAAQ